MAKWIEWMLGNNECCSASRPHLFLVCNLSERNTFEKHKHWRWWDDNVCLGEKEHQWHMWLGLTPLMGDSQNNIKKRKILWKYNANSEWPGLHYDLYGTDISHAIWDCCSRGPSLSYQGSNVITPKSPSFKVAPTIIKAKHVCIILKHSPFLLLL